MLRALVVGAGWMGTLHARLLAESRLAELCGIVDIDAGSAARVGKEFSVPHFSDVELAISATKADIAVIATPDATHRAVAEPCLRNRVHTLIEKPLATRTSDAEAIRKLANDHGTRVMVGHILRFDPRYCQLVDQIRTGQFGNIALLTMSRWSRKSIGERVNSVTDPLWYNLIHAIDCVQWVGAATIERVSSTTWTDSNSGIRAVTATGYLSNGTMFQISASWSLPDGVLAGPLCTLEVHGSARFARVEELTHGVVTSDDTRSSGLDALGWPEVNGKLDGMLRNEVHHFLEAITDGSTFAVSIDDAIAAVRAAQMIERAALSAA